MMLRRTRTETDDERIERETNAKLDEIETRTNSERAEVEAKSVARFVETYDPARDPFYFFDERVADSVEQGLSKQFEDKAKRHRIILAVKEKDIETLVRLADTEELRRLAFGLVFEKRGPGRAKGEKRPADHHSTLKWRLEQARIDLDHIRQIWKADPELRQRPATLSPTPQEIAARRRGVTDPQLGNYLKRRRS